MNKLVEGVLVVGLILLHLAMAVVGMAISLVVTAMMLGLILAPFVWVWRWLAG